MNSVNLAIKIFLLSLLILNSCRFEKSGEKRPFLYEIDSLAANKEVANYLKSFKGLGDLGDDSKPLSPREELGSFNYAKDLSVDLVLSEPHVTQPVEIYFDYKGRLWVVQYDQYPYPAGLKITSTDNYLRFTYNKVIKPPPFGAKGASKISFFVDTDGDGRFDKAVDAVTGLNIATSVTLGRGRIWVLAPPYLLSYRDSDGDGIPDGQPVVEIQGFGLQDTHSVANSLMWGPDGWLYGVNGSTTTSKISSLATKDLLLRGQNVWRYNTDTHVIERFAEGGYNNPFNVEIDNKGRLFSGSNAYDRGPYYKQGAYYVKFPGKHGAFSNPYIFGYLLDMPTKGDKQRFTHAFIRYEGGSLPKRYQDKIIAINILNRYVLLSHFESYGSSLKTIDEERILTTTDHWFRPVDIQSGPDGAVYISDWYDTRISHADPRDNWSKSTGRIFRLRNKDRRAGYPKFDLSTYSNDQLVKLLSNRNQWYRKQAILLLGNRKDSEVIPKLIHLLKTTDSGQTALEALWAINASGGFNDKVVSYALNYKDPYVRMWAVRLLGDPKEKLPAPILKQLIQLAFKEPNAEVRSQIACTAKRLRGKDAIPIIENLLKGHNDANDPDIPLLIWWAIESKTESARKEVLSLFTSPKMWKNQIMHDVVLTRIMKRYIMAGGEENYETARKLFNLCPSVQYSGLLVKGLIEGLDDNGIQALPADLVKIIKPYYSKFEKAPLTFELKRGKQPEVVDSALEIIADKKAELGYRLSYIQIMGEIDEPKSISILLKIVKDREASTALRIASLRALSRYDKPEVIQQVLEAYPRLLRANISVRNAAIELFTTRINWAESFLQTIIRKKNISKNDVSEYLVNRFRVLDDPDVIRMADQLWPETRPLSPSEITERINKVSKLLRKGAVNPSKGRRVFLTTCGRCHRLFGEGGSIGPVLTGYDRSNTKELLINIIDPNAYIREEYAVKKIVTKDGRIFEGNVVDGNGSSVTFEPPLGGKKRTFSKDQIKAINDRLTSIMPERILDSLTDQQIRDLFSYLQKKGEK